MCILFTFRSNVRIDTWWIQPCTYPEYMCSIRGCMKQKIEPLFEFSPFFLCFAALHCMRCSFRNRINPKWQTLGQGILWIIARTTITEYCSSPTQCEKLPQLNMGFIKFQGCVQLLNKRQVWPSLKDLWNISKKTDSARLHRMLGEQSKDAVKPLQLWQYCNIFQKYLQSWQHCALITTCSIAIECWAGTNWSIWKLLSKSEPIKRDSDGGRKCIWWQQAAFLPFCSLSIASYF